MQGTNTGNLSRELIQETHAGDFPLNPLLGFGGLRTGCTPENGIEGQGTGPGSLSGDHFPTRLSGATSVQRDFMRSMHAFEDPGCSATASEISNKQLLHLK